MGKLKTEEDKLPITPSVVSWARKRAQYSIEEAKEHFRNIAEWEDGISWPTYPQLEQMSDKFKCPIAVFFFPKPPESEAIQQTFRTLPEQEFELIPRAVKVLLRKGRAMQINLAELNDDTNPANKLITKDLQFNIDGSIDEMAASVRKYLGVSLDQQFQWPTADEALENWRRTLNDSGIFIFKDPFYNGKYSGFCLYDNIFPIIYVNNTTTKTRQIFTIFHELAHLIFHTSGIDTLDDSYVDSLPDNEQKIEVICNRFAGQFLVPEDTFEEFLAEYLPNKETASLLANKYCVSREVIYRKFLDRDLITQNEYDSAADLWRKQKGRDGNGGNYHYNQRVYLGDQYINLAFKRYYQNRFDLVRLAEYLNMKPKNVNKFEATYVRITSG